MRTLCDACESAPAIVFCSADEAALCRSCDEKVHLCNKLASRHVRVRLAPPIDLPCCDICENASAFFYCDVDGTSLCLQCDLSVHVGGKRTHERYLLFRQKVEFPGDKEPISQPTDPVETRSGQDHRISPPLDLDASADGHTMMDTKMIDLNLKPPRIHGQGSSNQEQ